MTVTSNLKGTSSPSFTIGKRGATVYQGTAAPNSGDGAVGDIYVRTGSNSSLYQKTSLGWNALGGQVSGIYNGTTSVVVNSDSAIVTVEAKTLLEMVANVAAVGGEKLRLTHGSGYVTLNAIATNNEANVDFVVSPQGAGVFKIKTEGESGIITEDCSSITINPAEKATGKGGSIYVTAGGTTENGQSGGDVVLTPGYGGTGATSAQVLLPEDYVATAKNSIITKQDVRTYTVTNITSGTTYNLGNDDQIIFVKLGTSAAFTVNLPASYTVGKAVTIKNGNVSHNLTVAATSVDGGTSVTVAQNYGKATFVFTASVWISI